MKGRFSSVWRVATALVLALSLALVTAAPAAAATAVSAVTVVPTSRLAAATTKYDITMTTATTLVGDTDTISIEFPTGIIPSANAASASDVTIGGTNLDHTNKYVVTGQRVTLEVPVDKSAGSLTVVIGVSGTLVTNPAAGSYQLTVYTSKDTTPVLSTAFIIGGSADSKGGLSGNVVLSTYTVGVVAQYTIPVTTQGTTLAANVDTITITFPTGTTVPASITSAAYVTINGVNLDATTDYSGNATSRVVTLTVPANVTAGNFNVIFLTGAAIKNPTVIPTTNSGKPTLTLHTSQEPIESAVQDYNATLVAGAGSLIKLTAPTVFSFTPDATTTFTVKATDSYGNLTGSGTPTITFETSSGTGGFADISKAMEAGVVSTTYTDTTAGTSTVTIKASPQTTYTNTITQTIVVNPQVALWHVGSLVKSYSTIQAAINAALPGDTIKVGAGTYTESLSITKHHLTLESTAGKATTFIKGAGTVGGNVEYALTLGTGADNFVLGGAADKGFTISSAGDNWLIVLNATLSDVTISYNTLDITGNPDRAISTTDDKAITTLTVTNNTFTLPDLYDIGIRDNGSSGDIVGVTLTNNSFTGTYPTVADSSAIEWLKLSIATVSSTISGNTITNLANGIVIGNDNVGGLKSHASTYKPLTISGNTFTGLNRAIDLRNATDESHVHAVVVKTNTFSNNIYGFSINKGAYPAATDKWQPEDMTVKYNDFSGNTYAVYNNADSSVTLTAEHNYWGHASGAKITATNPSGRGDEVSSKVDYSPWLYDAQATVVASGKSQYATTVLLSNVATLSGSTYSGGWNTFSTPIYLDSSADTWGEILSTANATAQVVSAYGWDGTNWTTLGTTTAITPLNAVFVQLKTAQSLPILYSTQLLVAPTKTMHAAAGSYTGWELVGLANLSAMDFDTNALVSINTKYSQVIDPISGSVLGGTDAMAVGAGYWVFMTADSTLAGFSVTPVSFVAVP